MSIPNPSRETILKQIRRALSIPAPKPGHHNGESLPQKETFQSTLPILNPSPATPEKRDWLPPVGDTWDDWAALFAANSLDLKTQWILCDDETEWKSHLEMLKTENGWTKIALHRGDLTERAGEVLGLETLVVDDGYDPHQLEKCDAGFTLCDGLVAQTGSILISNAGSGGRVLSVLPPHHVVLARREQLLPDLPAAFELLQEKYGASYPSSMGFITGPSRTGDIERILVLGAHGPKKLTILCV